MVNRENEAFAIPQKMAGGKIVSLKYHLIVNISSIRKQFYDRIVSSQIQQYKLRVKDVLEATNDW